MKEGEKLFKFANKFWSYRSVYYDTSQTQKSVPIYYCNGLKNFVDLEVFKERLKNLAKNDQFAFETKNPNGKNETSQGLVKNWEYWNKKPIPRTTGDLEYV